MDTTTNNEETPRPAMIVNLATRNANPDEEREYCEAPDVDDTAEWIYDEEPGEMPYEGDVEYTHPEFDE